MQCPLTGSEYKIKAPIPNYFNTVCQRSKEKSFMKTNANKLTYAYF